MTEEITNRAKTFIGHWSKAEPSPEAVRVAELLELWQGLHHMDDEQMRKADWTRFFVMIQVHKGFGLATFDFDDLTRLVFLAHDLCIRVDIQAQSNRYLSITFHPRMARTGNMSSRHPTLGQQFQLYRERFPAATTELHFPNR